MRKKKNISKKENSVPHGQVMTMFESLQDQIGAVAENIDTKIDVKIDGLRDEMKTEIGGLRSEMKTEIGGLRSEMKTEIGGLRSEMKTEIGGLRSEMKTEIGGLRSEMNEKFEIIMKHLYRIDDELAELKAGMREIKSNIVNKKEFVFWKKRVLRLEEELKEQKNLVSSLMKNQV